MATIKDVAQEAGVGIGTASRALSGGGSVKPETKQRIEEAAKKLGFVPNQQARNLKKQSTGCIAVLCPTIFHPFFAKMAFYIEDEIYAKGDRMVVVSSQDNLQKEKTILEMIEQKRVDGIVFITHYDHSDIDPALPIVSIDRHFGAGVPYVTSNNYQISREAVEKLIASGSKKVGCVCGVTAVESETKYRYEQKCAYGEQRHSRRRWYTVHIRKRKTVRDRRGCDRRIGSDCDFGGYMLRRRYKHTRYSRKSIFKICFTQASGRGNGVPKRNERRHVCRQSFCR